MTAIPSTSAATTRNGAADWHVSPVVDLAAYHFSWLWILVPLAMAGDHHPKDYYGLFMVGMLTSFIHRHLTLPYVYGDGQVFARHPARFTLFPALIVAGFLATPAVWTWTAPAGTFDRLSAAAFAVGAVALVHALWAEHFAGGIPAKTLAKACAPLALPAIAFAAWMAGVPTGFGGLATVLGAGVACAILSYERKAWGWTVAVVAALAVAAVAPMPGVVRMDLAFGAVAVTSGLWNIWHTLMQKYGILRMYNAKSGDRVPGWVDRLLVFGILPLLLVSMATSQGPLILKLTTAFNAYTLPMVNGLTAAHDWIVVPVGLLAAAAIALFAWHEARGGWSLARVSMATGTVLLFGSFFFVNPLKVYIAFGFSHAIEYVVFVWAFQRKRYAAPLAHDPLLGRLLRHPILFYVGFLSIFAVMDFVFEWGQHYKVTSPLTIIGTTGRDWMFFWTVWNSMIHFYFDGFLWKMRLPAVRASI